MNIIGKTSIHPFLFYTGKVAGYVIWIIFIFSIFLRLTHLWQQNDFLRILSYILAIIALIIIVISLINLGLSTRLGLPKEDTKLITSGLYRYSRNPMYLAFDILTIAAVIFTWNCLTVLLGIYSIIIYHFIIRAEEMFLENRFGNIFLEYRKKVRRYI